MSYDASIERAWGDGEHKFRLSIKYLRELQDKCKAGPAMLFTRLQTGQWMVDDIRETIRLGLIGGGMPSVEALVLTVRYVDDRPLMENVGMAIEIIGAALVGVPEDQPAGKATPEETPEMDGSASPNFTAQGPSLAGTLVS
jgi:hypothetical protein